MKDIQKKEIIDTTIPDHFAVWDEATVKRVITWARKNNVPYGSSFTDILNMMLDALEYTI